MRDTRIVRRIRLRLAAIWRSLKIHLGVGTAPTEFRSYLNVHTRVTFRAFTDAVLPETPTLSDELGPEHVPGGLAVGLDDFAIIYVDNLFQFGRPRRKSYRNIPLAIPVARVLDIAAVKLLSRNLNESELSIDRMISLKPDNISMTKFIAAAGPFSMLSRNDRLRAISVLDELEIELAPSENVLFELDAGLVGQLVVGFTEMIYYSEWQGYDEFMQPPSKRVHPNNPSAVQSWRQTQYPGFADGYAVLRGYVGTDDGSLGIGEIWTTIDEDAASPVRIMHQSGSFRENDYDTSEYEEPYPE